MKYCYLTYFLLLLLSCSQKNNTYVALDKFPPIYPDYSGVVIPLNIAPLNFYLDDYCEQVEARFFIHGEEQLACYGKPIIDIPIKKWKALLQKAYQDKQSIEIEIARKVKDKWEKYKSIQVNVAEEIDPYIAYRLIPPGYVNWDKIGIYQRNLSNFEETPIIENTLTDNNCMNCHSFSNHRPDRFIIHMRGKVNGTILMADGQLKKLNTKTDKTISTFTYPAWHPSGKFIAFSTNKTEQFFHAMKEKQIEVFDECSDIVLYDVESNTVLTDTLLMSVSKMETYPTWSPDGKTLYFCSTDTATAYVDYQKLQYKIYSIGFDPETRRFSRQIDTIYAPKDSSCVFPRLSPDGRFLLCSRMDYGCFPIWHKEADLCMIDLQNGQEIMGEANSDQAESYHSWSSNGKWVMFGSRKQDGFFTRLYFSYVTPEGKMLKPFLLPQKTFDQSKPFFKSYNVPEFLSGEVTVSPYSIARCAEKEGIQVQAE